MGPRALLPIYLGLCALVCAVAVLPAIAAAALLGGVVAGAVAGLVIGWRALPPNVRPFIAASMRARYRDRRRAVEL